MKTIDTAVLARYNAGMERSRLRTGEGLLAVSKKSRCAEEDPR